MMQKKFLLGLILPSLLLSACSFNLGNFEKDDNYESYYEAFGPVRAIYDRGDDYGITNSYNIKDSLFNDYTVNSLDWEDDDDKVEDRQYVYLVIEFLEALKIQTIALYIKSEATGVVDVSSFYYPSEDDAPDKIRYLSSPSTDHGTPIHYDDLPASESIASNHFSANENKWKDFSLTNFQQGAYEDKCLHTNKGGLLYIRIENNSGLNIPAMTPISFTFLNLLIRAID